MILPQRTWMSESERIAKLSPRICTNEPCGNKARYPSEICEACIEKAAKAQAEKETL